MGGYIGTKASVTQVDGYNRSEADDRYVNAAGDTMTGELGLTDNLSLYRTSSSVDGDVLGKVSFTNSYENPDYTASIEAVRGVYGNNIGLRFNVQQGGGGGSPVSITAISANSNGLVTMPYQPSWSLQPNFSGVNTLSGDNRIPFAVTPNHRCYANNVSVSTGRVTVPISGKYFVCAVWRQEDTTTDYQLSIKVNGAAVSRGGIWFTSQPYESVHQYRVLNLSANDYVEIYIGGGTVAYAGYGDHLTFFEGYLIG